VNNEQWYLDKLIEHGKITAANTVLIERLTREVGDLKGLYDRTRTLEGEVDSLKKSESDREDAEQLDAQTAALTKPAHRQGAIAIVALVLAALSWVTTVALTIIFHH
jgi:hypothetical protein